MIFLKKTIKTLTLFLLCFIVHDASAQLQLGNKKIEYHSPKQYNIAGILIEGADKLDQNAIRLITELKIGDKVTVPGDRFARAIEKLWAQRLFTDVQIYASKILGENIYITIQLQERPRLSRYKFTGVSKSHKDDIKEQISLFSGKSLTDNLLVETKNTIRSFYIEKGFRNVSIDFVKTKDTLINNSVSLNIIVEKGKKVKIEDVLVSGNEVFTDAKVRKYLKQTKSFKWYKFFNSSKYIQSEFDDDKNALITKYNAKGYRDARIVRDSIYDVSSKRMVVELEVNEGKQHFFGDITWVGNSIYRSSYLDTILGINKGDVYNQELLTSRLHASQNNRDITSLYMDNGYLFFSITPVEISIHNDTINYEMRINEGKQARIKRILIKGNSKTNDYVIRREIRTKPGQLFNRNDIIRTQREISSLGYFNPETFGVQPKPDPVSGTVDIEYTVEEKASDQIELSGGFGGGRLVGTLGLSFNNFSTKNFWDKKSWSPLPSGDGQKLSLRAQTSGNIYNSINFSFTEPWLGGKKPTSLSVGLYYQLQTNGRTLSQDENRPIFKTLGLEVGLGKRKQWPDDYFTVAHKISYQRYDIYDKRGYFGFALNDGVAHNIAYTYKLSRNSVSQPFFPRSGSQVSFTMKLTLPYSWLTNKDYSDPDLDPNEKFKFVEYNKFKFAYSWYTPLTKDKQQRVVLALKAGYGFVSSYSKELGAPPFERFYLGGTGLSGFNLYDGREIVGLRGYQDNAVSSSSGDQIIAKFSLETRFLISPNPSALIYALTFAEAGNTWQNFSTFDPFQLKKSAGVGLRVFLPAFGLLGIDYAWGLDQLDENASGFGSHQPGKGDWFFTIGMNIGEL